MTNRRRGFTMVEILVTLAITGVLAAVLWANLGGLHEQARTAKMVENLGTIAQALREFDRQTGRYPEDLSLLTVKPTTSSKDICGNTFPQTAVDRWKGPYVGTAISAAGIVLEIDTIQDGIKRKPGTPADPSQAGELQVFVNNVTNALALELDADLDGDGLLTKGPIQWNTSPGYPRLIYSIVVSGC